MAYIVFNDITGKVEESTTPPPFGDPNAGVSNTISTTYGGSGGSQTIDLPTPSTLGIPINDVLSAAVTSNLDPAVQQQIVSAYGPLAGISQVPNMLASMSAHSTNVLNNSAKVFGAINEVFQPEEVGRPERCASISDFVGSVQGKYSGALNSIGTGLGTIAGALLSVPLGVIGGVVGASAALLTAIAGGVATVISAAIGAVSATVGVLFNAVGTVVSGVMNAVGSAVGMVFSAVTTEIANVANAIALSLSNPFRLLYPHTNDCIKNAYENNGLQSTAGDAFAAPVTNPYRDPNTGQLQYRQASTVDRRPDYTSPTGWRNSQGQPVNPDGTPAESYGPAYTAQPSDLANLIRR